MLNFVFSVSTSSVRRIIRGLSFFRFQGGHFLIRTWRFRTVLGIGISVSCCCHAQSRFQREHFFCEADHSGPFVLSDPGWSLLIRHGHPHVNISMKNRLVTQPNTRELLKSPQIGSTTSKRWLYKNLVFFFGWGGRDSENLLFFRGRPDCQLLMV